MTPIFKKAGAEDVGIIGLIAEKAWPAAYGDILSDAQINYMLSLMYSEEEIARQIGLPDYHYYLVDHGNSTVGFIGFETNYEDFTTKLHRLYLLPEAKGKGLGKAAIDLVKVKSVEAGNRRIILNVNKQNTAQEFYASQGFSVYGEGVFDISSGYVMDDYLMEYLS